MATADTCTKPEEGWALVSHFLGNILVLIRMTVHDKEEGWQDKVAQSRTRLLVQLTKIVARMNEHGHGDDAAKMDQIRALIEGSDLNSLGAIEAIFAMEKELSPSCREMDRTLDLLFGRTEGPGAKPFPASRGLLDGTYHFRTDLIQQAGEVPICCGEPMTATDDHGRFRCFKCGNLVAV